jgi:hypothetical protein
MSIVMELSSIEIIERLKTSLKIKTDTELNKALSLSNGTATGWKKRGTVPYKEVYEASRKTGYSMDWILTGKG